MVADYLLQHVLHGDDAQGAAVFVRHNGEVLLRVPQLREHLRELYRLVDVERLHEQGADVGPLVFRQGLQEVVEVEEADDIVYAVLVHGQAGGGWSYL